MLRISCYHFLLISLVLIGTGRGHSRSEYHRFTNILKPILRPRVPDTIGNLIVRHVSRLIWESNWEFYQLIIWFNSVHNQPITFEWIQSDHWWIRGHNTRWRTNPFPEHHRKSATGSLFTIGRRVSFWFEKTQWIHRRHRLSCSMCDFVKYGRKISDITTRFAIVVGFGIFWRRRGASVVVRLRLTVRSSTFGGSMVKTETKQHLWFEITSRPDWSVCSSWFDWFEKPAVFKRLSTLVGHRV